MSDKFPQPATGLPGFGCSFLLAFVAGVAFLVAVDQVTPRAFGLLALISIAAGLVTARFGERVFAFVLRLASLFGSW